MLVRHFGPLACIAVAASVGAQAPATNDEVTAAMRLFASSPSLKMTLDGTETINGRGKSIHVDASMLVASTASGTIVGLIEIAEFQNGQLTQRTIGDGQTLWFYNPRANEYMSKPYGSLGSGEPSSYYAKLSDALAAYVSGYGTYPVRYLRDILYRRDTFGALGAAYRSWLPGFAPVRLSNGMPPYKDPINPNRKYVAGPETYFLHTVNGQKPTKSLTYEFWAGSSTNVLAFAYFSELVPLGSRTQLIDWQMEFVTSGLVFQPATFQFVPPAGSRAVPLPK